MKKLFTLLILVFVLPSVLAINLIIEKQSSNEVIIQGLNEPAIFNLRITNVGDSDNFQFYNLLGFSMAPKGTVQINKGETKEIKLMIYPQDDFSLRGFYTFEYFIRSQDKTEISQRLTIKIVDLENVFEIGSGEIDPESNSMEIYIHNKENFNFKNINTKFNSVFFDFEENFQLEANERKTFDIQLNKEDFKKLIAGFYTLNAEINIENLNAEIEGLIKFAEKDILTTTKRDYGIIINTQIIEKKNEGNIAVKSETVIKKNIISRLFTSFSPEPDVVERQRVNIYYTWSREIAPGESLEIVVKTNWVIPLFLVLFVVIIVALTRYYSSTDLTLRKRVSFVKAKGGEFALKVSIIVNAKKHVERVNIIDRLPSLVKIYERFGGEKPTRINEKTRRIEWDLDKLDEGETRVLSYIIYSKIGVIGKFALPEATAIYEQEGKIHESSSNKAFFIAEQQKGDVEED